MSTIKNLYIKNLGAQHRNIINKLNVIIIKILLPVGHECE